MSDNIYEMQLFDTVLVSNRSEECIEITRVPGGWIWQRSQDGGVSDVFVPYNEEFKAKRGAK